MKSFSLCTYRITSSSKSVVDPGVAVPSKSSVTTCEPSVTSTDPHSSEKELVKLFNAQQLCRPLRLQLVVAVRNQSEITSSAGLDDDDLWFVHQVTTLHCVQVFVHFVNGKFIRRFLCVVDSIDILPRSVRHDDHHHAVRVFEFRMF